MSEYVRIYEDFPALHGKHGWELVAMDWDPDTGSSCFQYERHIQGEGTELAIIWRDQPTIEAHQGWSTRNRDEVVLPLTDCDWSRWDRGLYSEPVEIEYDEP